MLHAHTMVHGPCSPYTGPGMHVNDCLHCIVQLLIDALSQENVQNN